MNLIKPDHLPVRIALILLLSISYIECKGQFSDSDPETAIGNVLQYASERYGGDQQLFNGRIHEYQYRYALGHPFFQENEFTEGALMLHNKLYNGISMKYDIYSQELIINSSIGKQMMSFYPPAEFVKSFIIYDKVFERRSYNNEAPSYFQVVAESGQVSCLYSWYKTRVESDHNITFSSYKFGRSQRNNYLVIDNNISQYRNNKSFKKTFPEQFQRNISAYLKSKKLSVKNAGDSEMKEIINYCQSILKGPDLQ